jgi:hypothetical protein
MHAAQSRLVKIDMSGVLQWVPFHRHIEVQNGWCANVSDSTLIIPVAGFRIKAGYFERIGKLLEFRDLEITPLSRTGADAAGFARRSARRRGTGEGWQARAGGLLVV